MLRSNERRLALSGWLMNGSKSSYNDSLKLQKYLFFYEMFSKVDEDEYDLSNLCGYKNGPVFSNVWRDYTYNRVEFDKAAELTLNRSQSVVNCERAERSMFVVDTLSVDDLIVLTHKFNIWQAKENRINNGERDVMLDERDFAEGDADIVKMLERMYSDDLVRNSVVLGYGRVSFVVPKNQYEQLTASHRRTLARLSKNHDLINPVFVSIRDDGVLEID